MSGFVVQPESTFSPRTLSQVSEETNQKPHDIPSLPIESKEDNKNNKTSNIQSRELHINTTTPNTTSNTTTSATTTSINTTTNTTNTTTTTTATTTTTTTAPAKRLSITSIVHSKILGHKSKDQTEKEEKPKEKTYVEEDSPEEIQQKREAEEKADCLLTIKVNKGEIIHSHPSYQVKR